jgi:glycosyltransferase involved in cell wall biosynthesis
MKVSLCTWVKDWPPLRQTLECNARRIAGRNVEWCITDFGSTDDTWTWLESCAAQWTQIRVFRGVCEPLHFARCYNQAFRHARGEILVCLDGDNEIGPRFLPEIERKLAERRDLVLHVWSGNWTDGTCGRLVLPREVYQDLGGYDERLGPCGYQDLDLRDRARAAGYLVQTILDPAVVGSAIRTSREDKLRYLDVEDYETVNRGNWTRSRASILAKRYRANQP